MLPWRLRFVQPTNDVNKHGGQEGLGEESIAGKTISLEGFPEHQKDRNVRNPPKHISSSCASTYIPSLQPYVSIGFA
jgi:hypothetical protein